MKKILISVLVAVVLFWSSGKVSAKDETKGSGKRTERIEDKTKALGKSQSSEEDEKTSESKEKVEEKVATKDKLVRKNIVNGKVKSKTLEDKTGKGINHQQQLQSLQKQLAHEQAKYMRRRARLERIKQLATEAGKTEILERVNKLLKKEQQRYNRKHKKMLQAQQEIMQQGQRVGDKTPKKIEEGSKKDKLEAESKNSD